MPDSDIPLRKVWIVPHTHWDREWYHQEHRFRHRLVPIVDDIIDELNRDPEVTRFLLDGQLAIVADYLEIKPERRPALERLARDGRLVLGPWYVLADELLSSDETLVRNLLLGKRDGEALGNWMPVGYCPDSFGHPAIMPTLLAGFGIRHAIVWRGYGGEPAQDKDLFRWVGPEGSSVITHHLPPDGYEFGANLPTDRADLRERWRVIRSALEPRSTNGIVMVMNGADHHALQTGLPMAVRVLSAIDPDIAFRVGSPTDYFRDVTDAPMADIEGELRFSYRYTWTLQGVAASRSRIKRLMSEADRLLVRWTEPQCALASTNGIDRRSLLRAVWRGHLESCAHDSFGGCCTDAVARDIEHRAGNVVSSARFLCCDAIGDRLNQHASRVRRATARWRPVLAIVNPSATERGGVVEATLTFKLDDVPVGKPGGAAVPGGLPPVPPFDLVGTRGWLSYQILGHYIGYDRLESPNDYPDQDLVHAVRVAVDTPALPSLGATTAEVRERRRARGKSAGRRDRVGVRGGRITGRVTVAAGANAFDVFTSSGPMVEAIAQLVSEPDIGDTYTHQPPLDGHVLPAEWGPVRRVFPGPLVACISRSFRVGDRAHGTVFARVHVGSAVVRWVIRGWNASGDHRLRAFFPVPGGRALGPAVVDMHYGPVTRDRALNRPESFEREWPATTAPVHGYVSVSGSGGGLSVFPRGVYEYELFEDAVAMTVLRAVGQLSRGNLPARPGHAAWPEPTPDAQEIGPFHAEFGTVLDAVTEQGQGDRWHDFHALVEEFHAPLAGLMFRRSVAMPASVTGPTLEGVGLVFKSLKPAENERAVVLRCVNVTSERTPGSWRWPAPVERAVRARLDETPVADLPLSSDRTRIDFVAGPRDVVTILVWCAASSDRANP